MIGSKLLKNGTWKGRKELGLILAEIRDDLKRERNWTEIRASSSDDQTQENPLPLPSQPEGPINSDDSHKDDLDFAALTQSTQNVSLRRRSNHQSKMSSKKNQKPNKTKNPQPDSIVLGASTLDGNQAVASANLNPLLPFGHAHMTSTAMPGFSSMQSVPNWPAHLNA